MNYYIQQLSSTSNNINYWTAILDSNGNEYTTTDVVILEAKLLEIYESVPKNKIQVISKHTVTDDLEIV